MSGRSATEEVVGNQFFIESPSVELVLGAGEAAVCGKSGGLTRDTWSSGVSLELCCRLKRDGLNSISELHEVRKKLVIVTALSPGPSLVFCLAFLSAVGA